MFGWQFHHELDAYWGDQMRQRIFTQLLNQFEAALDLAGVAVCKSQMLRLNTVGTNGSGRFFKIATGEKFIFGLPINCATKVFAGV